MTGITLNKYYAAEGGSFKKGDAGDDASCLSQPINKRSISVLISSYETDPSRCWDG